jgi:hypothetical protein
LDVLAGRQRLRLDVAHRPQLEPGGGEQGRPVGEQLPARVIEQRAQRPVLGRGRRPVEHQVTETGLPARSTRRSCASSRGLSAVRTQISPAASRQIAASKPPSGNGMCSTLPWRMSTRAASPARAVSSRPGRTCARLMFSPTISQSMREALRRAGSPMPQPTSSTRIPGRIPASSQTRAGAGVQRLREGLPAIGKEPEMKTAAGEQPPIVGDQIEVGGDPPHRAAAAQQPRQPGTRGAEGLPEQPPAQAPRRIGALIPSHNR